MTLTDEWEVNKSSITGDFIDCSELIERTVNHKGIYFVYTMGISTHINKIELEIKTFIMTHRNDYYYIGKLSPSFSNLGSLDALLDNVAEIIVCKLQDNVEHSTVRSVDQARIALAQDLHEIEFNVEINYREFRTILEYIEEVAMPISRW